MSLSVPQDVVIVGAGKLGALIHDCLHGDERWACTAFHDDAAGAGLLHGLPVLGIGAGALRPGQRAILGVGDPGLRRALTERLAPLGLDWVTFIDRRSVVGPAARLGRGTVVLSFAMIASDVVAGPFCYFSPYSHAGAGAAIGACTSVLGNASVGESVIGEECLLGLRSACLDGAVLGDRVVVAPFTLVRRAVPSDSLVAGNPARIVPRGQGGGSISAGP